MMKALTATLRAIEFLLPSFLLFLAATVAVSAVSSFAQGVKFRRQFELAVVFGAFAYVLGVFIGTAGSSEVSSVTGTVLGTVSTLLSALLTYLIGNKTKPETQKLLMSAMLSFLMTLLLTVFYLRKYFAA